eukprot:1027626-Heterocapsa_arctica.AAC.1
MGIDAAGGRRRRTTIQDLRRSKNARRIARLKLIRHMLKYKGRKAISKLWKTGAWPALTYGITTQGTSHASMAKLRAMAAECIGFEMGGICRTTAIHL